MSKKPPKNPPCDHCWVKDWIGGRYMMVCLNCNTTKKA